MYMCMPAPLCFCLCVVSTCFVLSVEWWNFISAAPKEKSSICTIAELRKSQFCVLRWFSLITWKVNNKKKLFVVLRSTISCLINTHIKNKCCCFVFLVINKKCSYCGETAMDLSSLPKEKSSNCTSPSFSVFSMGSWSWSSYRATKNV